MKKMFFVLMLLLLAALISVSCISTPQPEDRPKGEIISGSMNDDKPEEKPAEQLPQRASRSSVSEEQLPQRESRSDVSEEQLPQRASRLDPSMIDAAKVKADAAKKLAVDFETPAYFPSEWEAVEARYKAAGEMPKTANDDMQKVIAEYDAAAAAYEELFKKTTPLYAQAREDEIMATREKLISTGFTEYFPEYLKKADDVTLTALDQYEAEDYYTARETAAKALNEYETLLLGADVFLARQEIIDRGFLKYDKENFSKADEIAETAIKDYDAGNKEKAIESAQEALLRYNLVLSNGWAVYSTERKAAADAERELAITEKANIASRDIFREAEGLYNQAESDLSSGNHNAAAVQYTEAEAMYSIARKDTAKKRQIAEATIRRAEVKIVESGDTASEAKRILEGGSK